MVSKHIVFVIYDYKTSKLKLQPWRYYVEFVRALLNRGAKVTILTNNTDISDAGSEQLKILETRISPFHQKELFYLLSNIKADQYVFWGSKKMFLYYNLFRRLPAPVSVFYTGSFYYLSEIIRVVKHLKVRDYLPYLIDATAPMFFTKTLINSQIVLNTLVLSERNKERLIKAGVHESKIVVGSIGIDRNETTVNGTSKLEFIEKENVILYMTSAIRIRGIFVLLKAFSQVSVQNKKLIILARGANEMDKIKLLKAAEKLNIDKNCLDIHIGWLNRQRIDSLLLKAKALVMPFLLVPSEMPISIFEAFKMGIPVIAPDLDGIPEIVKGKGIIYKHYKITELINALEIIMQNYDTQKEYKKNISYFIKSHPTWEEEMDRIIPLLLR